MSPASERFDRFKSVAMTRKRLPTRRATFTSVTPFRSASVQAAHRRRPSEASSTSHTDGDRLSGAPTWTQEVPARLGRETVRTPASESDATYGVSPTTASATCGTFGVTTSVVPPGAGSATRCQAASSARDAAGSASAARAIATSSLIRETGTALRIIPSLLCPHVHGYRISGLIPQSRNPQRYKTGAPGG